MDKPRKRSAFLEMLLERSRENVNMEDLDEETTRIVERVVVLRNATNHVNM
mgnify:CR=1 FL=1